MVDQHAFDELGRRVAMLEERLEAALPRIAVRADLQPVQLIVVDAAEFFDLPVERITGPERSAPCVEARAAVVWVARRSLRWPYSRIGRALSRDHSTLMSAEQKAIELRRTDSDYERISDEMLAACNMRRAAQ